MNLYESKVNDDLKKWRAGILKKPPLLSRAAQTVQDKARLLIPAKAQHMITEAVKKMTEAIMLGSGVTTSQTPAENLALAERDWLVQEKFLTYQKVATLQGAGFGAGGILLGLADFPVLLSIKVKFLYEAAALYGYNTAEESERFFLLHIFHLAFSNNEHRAQIFRRLEDWDHLPSKETVLNWEKFQIEYQDYIDLAKLLQLVPVVGAAVGATANYSLLKRLKIYTMNCYRLRLLKADHK